ncbi:MAG TPA: hypothetical protein VL147_12175 [Devosia sp.]|nr:hypothetical protein [Devosia sp.]
MNTKTTDSANIRNAGWPGATATFPYDRMTVEHFRKTFPRARWSDERKAWFVPGKTAARRFERWLEREFAGANPHDDMRGRDAYAFDPVVRNISFLMATGWRIARPIPAPSSMRCAKFPLCLGMARVWTVPYRSYDELRRRWSRIEAAGARNEPEVR